jgi:hypothetical protein
VVRGGFYAGNTRPKGEVQIVRVVTENSSGSLMLRGLLAFVEETLGFWLVTLPEFPSDVCCLCDRLTGFNFNSPCLVFKRVGIGTIATEDFWFQGSGYFWGEEKMDCAD